MRTHKKMKDECCKKFEMLAKPIANSKWPYGWHGKNDDHYRNRMVPFCSHKYHDMHADMSDIWWLVTNERNKLTDHHRWRTHRPLYRPWIDSASSAVLCDINSGNIVRCSWWQLSTIMHSLGALTTHVRLVDTQLDMIRLSHLLVELFGARADRGPI